jgi:hypothetical protein
MVIFVYEMFRFIYKCLYFYLFPYLVIPISYYTYDIFKWDKKRRAAAARLSADDIFLLQQFQEE